MNQNINTEVKIDGMVVRYGEDAETALNWIRKHHRSINLNKTEKKEKLGIVNRIIKEVEKGKQYTRREIDEMVGIYTLPDCYNI